MKTLIDCGKYKVKKMTQNPCRTFCASGIWCINF